MKRLKKIVTNNGYNKFLFVLLSMALISINIWLLSLISFVFVPIKILINTVVIPTVIAGVFYYLLVPLVDYLENKGIKRGVSIGMLFLMIFQTLFWSLFYIIPTMLRQIRHFYAEFPAWWYNITEEITEWEVPVWLEKYQQDLIYYISDESMDWLVFLDIEAVDIIYKVFPMIGTATGIITALVTIPFILFYLLKDGKKLPNNTISFLPPAYQKKSKEILKEMNEKISKFVRGQIIVSLCIGILLFIGYKIIGMPYALTLAIIAALTSVVPYLGPTIGIIPAIIVSLFTDPILLIKLIVVWTTVQLIEGKIITPQVMGKSIHVHPITIIFVILTAGKLFGPLGLIFAVPGYAVVKVIATHFYRWLKNVLKIYQTNNSVSTKKKEEVHEAL